MKTITLIMVVGALCLAGLWAIQKTQDVSVNVASCNADGPEAVVTVIYKNRLPRTVKVSYDLALTKDFTYNRSSAGSALPLKIQHLKSVVIGPNEERTEVIRLAFPPKVYIAGAAIMNVFYE